MDRTVSKKKKWEGILQLRRMRLFVGTSEPTDLLMEVFALFMNTFSVVICEIENNNEEAISALNRELSELIDDGKLPPTTVKLNGSVLNIIDYMLDAVVMSMFME